MAVLRGCRRDCIDRETSKSLDDRQILNNSATRSNAWTCLSKFLYQFLPFVEALANAGTDAGGAMTDARPPQRGGFELQPTDSQVVRPQFGSASWESDDSDHSYGSPEDFAVYSDVKTGRHIVIEENNYYYISA